mgnify:FL=1
MPPPTLSPDRDLYETDFYAWTQAQAAKLRRLGEQAVNLDLDLPRLAEEVEDLGKAERNAIRSQLIRIIEHCLKLEYSPAHAPRGDWRESIIEARDEIVGRMSPTLRRDLEGAVGGLFDRARRRAENALRKQDEHAAADALPETCPYALHDLLQDDWYPANRHRLSN